MKITIIKQIKRFQVKCCYNQKVFLIITKFKNRYFDVSTSIWCIPIDDFTSFIAELENDANEIKFDSKIIIDQPTIAYIETKDAKIHVSFSRFIDDFKIYCVPRPSIKLK